MTSWRALGIVLGVLGSFGWRWSIDTLGSMINYLLKHRLEFIRRLPSFGTER